MPSTSILAAVNAAIIETIMGSLEQRFRDWSDAIVSGQ